MHRLLALVSRFGRDERGVFAVIFGLMAIVLVALGGAAVDYVTLEQTRSRAQIALDAAVLALQPEIFRTPVNVADIRTRAEALLLQQLDGEFGVVASMGNPQVDVANGQLTLDAQLQVPTTFVALVGVSQLSARIRSQATRRQLNLEVIMVLDNSGSMSGTRMSNLKSAACNAVNILFYDRDGMGCVEPVGPPRNPNLRIGLVPFTSLVNIGTQYANAAWLDWTGASQAASGGYSAILNFDDDDTESTPFTGPMDRRTLFSQTGTSWQGCIEARIAPFDTTDDPPDLVTRKFIPLFSPDTYNSNNNYLSDTGGTCKPKTCTQVITRSCSGNKTNCNGAQSYTYTQSAAGVSTPMGATSCIPAGAATPTATVTYPNNSTQVSTRVYNIPLTNRELQSRLCKYNGVTVNSSSTNYTCPSASLLPLTNAPGTVLGRVNAMVASGNTNIQQGAVWGMHALTSGEPITDALPEEPGRVAKIMILMTDGINEPSLITSSSDMNGSVYYSWGFRYDGRLGPNTNNALNPKTSVDTAAEVTTAMDNRTKAACEYAKRHRGIEIYTIGLGATASTKLMLTACASSSSHAYFPTNPTQLNEVFRSIADKLSALRLSQ
ncbi:pilus assembly protein [Devosia lacusdianchii]|uniref:pilus assembly protein n=1 Tax=Devosia lacusdianchii TaxID=2917991 RepID=UPI001F05EF46|nr:pilus assembly protein [Devosia sp. JXJ CY 41]